MAFLDQPAYGGPQTWRQLCDQYPAAVDGAGMLAPPWGDAVRAAVAFEQNVPNWAEDPRYVDGPAGQVLGYLYARGFGDLVGAGDATEEAAKGGHLQLQGVPGMGGAPPPVQMQNWACPPYMACLSSVERIEVKEKVNLIEAISAIIGQEIEMANKYKIFNDGGEEELFFAVEETGCCTRQLKQCAPDCAPWTLSIFYTQGGANQQALKLHRDWTCTFCCFNRPVVEVTDAISNQKIGSLQDPFACCDLTFNVRGPDDETVLKANGGCCQLGLCCPLPCGPCAEVSFPVTDAKSGDTVGNVSKHVPGCCKFFFAPDVQNYKVEFGAVQNPQYKALLMALTIFIDFRYFQDNSNDDNGGIVGQMGGD